MSDQPKRWSKFFGSGKDKDQDRERERSPLPFNRLGNKVKRLLDREPVQTKHGLSVTPGVVENATKTSDYGVICLASNSISTASAANTTCDEQTVLNSYPGRTPERSLTPQLALLGTKGHKDLWDKAYCRLSNEKKELVETYESILTKNTDIPEGLSQREKMSTVISKELFIVTNRQWRVRIPGWRDPVLVRAVVDKLIGVILKFKDLGAAVASADPIHIGLPFAAICVLLPLITNDSQENNIALKGIGYITDLVDLYAGVEEEYLRRDKTSLVRNFAEKLENLYFDILDFLAEATCHFDRNTVERMMRNIPKIVDWDGRLKMIQSSDEVCRKFTQRFDSQDQRTGVYTIASLVEQQTRKTEELLEAFQRQSNQSRDIIAGVSSVNVESDHDRVRKKLGFRYRDSGQWLQSRYSTWIASKEKPTLWLCGSVGTGKSSLVSHVIEWHLNGIKASAQERLAFFYCSRKEGQRTPPLDIFRSLVAQLAWSLDGASVAELVKREYNVRKESSLSLEECSNLVVRLVEQYERTTIAVDALDECEDSPRFLLHLKKLLDSTHGAVKFFFSSRPNVQVPDSFPSLEKIDLDSATNLTVDDMQTYIRTQVKDRETLHLGTRLLNGNQPALEDRLIEILTRRSQGMFRWTELQLDLFFSPKSPFRLTRDVEVKLDKLEKELGLPELDSAYEEVYNMNTPHPGDRNMATKAYKWMLCARIPLHIETLTEVVSFDGAGFDPEINVKYILEICSNLIITEMSSGIVRFAHLSVREYLEKRVVSMVNEFSNIEAHTLVAETCLAYMNHSRLKDFTGQDGFARYVVLYWARHCEMSFENRTREGRLRTLFYDFLKLAFTEWVKVLPVATKNLYHWNTDGSRLEEMLEGCISSPPNSFFTACVWGFSEIILNSPTAIACLNELNSEGESGLHISSKYGRYDIVKTLLGIGVDVNARSGGNGWTALHQATRKGQEAIVRLLVEGGANVDAMDIDGRTPIHFPTVKGHEAMVRLLVEGGANVDAKGNDGWTPMHFATSKGYEAIVQLLVEGGANIDAKGNDGWTPMHFATSKGYEAIVKLLVEGGANIDAKANNGWTPIHFAASRGYEAVARRLLEKGADIEAKGNSGRTPLHEAAMEGHKALVQLLVEKGANIEAKNCYGWTPLYEAALNKHKAVVRLLVEKRADVWAMDGGGWTAPYHGARADQEEVVQLLLELLLEQWGTTNIHSVDYGNTVQAMAYRGRSTTMQLLIKFSPRKVTHHSAYANALHLACIKGHIAIVDQLLRLSIDPNKVDKHGWSAVSCAAYFQHAEILDSLPLPAGDRSLGSTEMLLPSKWNESDKSEILQLGDDGLSVRYTETETEATLVNLLTPEPATVRANHPIAIHSLPYYFETSILHAGVTGVVVIGLSHGYNPTRSLPGWTLGSWAYHSDDGKGFTDAFGKPYGETYTTGDIIGCSYSAGGIVAFTKNGKFFGTAFEGVWGKLFPAVGMMSQGAAVTVNFGPEGFRYNGETAELLESASYEILH